MFSIIVSVLAIVISIAAAVLSFRARRNYEKAMGIQSRMHPNDTKDPR